MIKLALRSALSDRASEGRVLVVDSWSWDAPRTKDAVAALGALGVDGRVLVVVGRDNASAALSFRNIPEVQLIAPGELNAYDVLCNDWIVFTEDTLPTSPAAVDGAPSADAATAPAKKAAPKPATAKKDPATAEETSTDEADASPDDASDDEIEAEDGES
jgi:large subunit ribosomal protein L4